MEGAALRRACHSRIREKGKEVALGDEEGDEAVRQNQGRHDGLDDAVDEAQQNGDSVACHLRRGGRIVVKRVCTGFVFK